MTKSRLEGFSDGVIAIIITIMVLEFKVPHGSSFTDLMPLLPVFLSYVLSFIYIGIYWNNHHHLFHAVKDINGAIMWANLHLLFWLSLVPFVTAWAGENHFTQVPLVLYGVVLFMAANAYYILTRVILAHDGKNSIVAKALGKDAKGIISTFIYLISIILAFYTPEAACAGYVLVALIWIVPDRRIVKALNRRSL